MDQDLSSDSEPSIALRMRNLWRRSRIGRRRRALQKYGNSRADSLFLSGLFHHCPSAFSRIFSNQVIQVNLLTLCVFFDFRRFDWWLIGINPPFSWGIRTTAPHLVVTTTTIVPLQFSSRWILHATVAELELQKKGSFSRAVWRILDESLSNRWGRWGNRMRLP